MVQNMKLLFILLLFISCSTYGVESSRQRHFKSDRDTDCPCGTTNYKDALITGGEEVTDLRKYPWIVSLHFRKFLELKWGACGGIIISSYYILTAAHCFQDEITPKIGLKGSDLTKPDKLLEIEEYTIHPEYESDKMKWSVNDVAVIKTKTPIPCSDFNRPVCLTKKNIFDVDDELIIVGFGHSEGMRSALDEGTVKVLSTDVCRETAEELEDYPIVDERDIICVVGTPATICHGDSGGPLLAKHKDKFYVVGVVAYNFGSKCEPGEKTVFMDVARYYSFIKEIAEDLPDL